MRRRLVNPIGLSGSIALLFMIGLAPARISAQSGVLNDTTFGGSQNDARDLMNSLVPGEKKFGKREKKQEVNTGELKSKTTKDTTFGGSLLNMGIVGAEPKLDESKLHSTPVEEKQSSASRPTTETTEKPAAFSNLSDTAVLAAESEEQKQAPEKELKTTTSTAAGSGDAQEKVNASTSATSATSDQKSSSASSEKPSASKPDPDH